MDPNVSSPQATQRVLATIVFTDIVDYSGQMARHEGRTFQLLQRDMQWLKDVCLYHDGTVVKSTGDGLMLYFVSVNSAVAFALDVQKGLVEMSDVWEPQDVLQHRMGIHLGDVFVLPDDVMGEGVNLASRIMGEAEPNGIALSGVVYEMVKGQLPAHTVFLGDRQLKHIPVAVPVYLVRPPKSGKPPAPVTTNPPSDAPARTASSLQLKVSVAKPIPSHRVAEGARERKVLVQKLQDGRLSVKGPYPTIHRWVVETAMNEKLILSTVNPQEYGFEASAKPLWEKTKISVKFYLVGMSHIVDIGDPNEFSTYPQKIRDLVLRLQEVLLADPPVPRSDEIDPGNFLTRLRPPPLKI